MNGKISQMSGNEENGKTVAEEFLLGTIGLNYSINPMYPSNIGAFVPWEYYQNLHILRMLTQMLKQQNDERITASIDAIDQYIFKASFIQSTTIFRQFQW